MPVELSPKQIEAIMGLYTATDQRQLARYVEEHPVLLEPWSEIVLGEMMAELAPHPEHRNMVATMKDWRRFLSRCRDQGITHTTAEHFDQETLDSTTRDQINSIFMTQIQHSPIASDNPFRTAMQWPNFESLPFTSRVSLIFNAALFDLNSFQFTHDREFLDLANAGLRQVLVLVGSSPFSAKTRCYLAGCLFEKFKASGDEDALSEACDLADQGLRALSIHAPSRPEMLQRFARHYLAVYTDTSAKEYLDRAARTQRELVLLASWALPSAVDSANVRLALVEMLCMQMSQEFSADTLKETTEILCIVGRIITPGLAETYAELECWRGHILLLKFQFHSANPEWLDQSIQEFDSALAHAPENWLQRSSCLVMLGGTLSSHYQVHGREEVLGRWVDTAEEAVALATEGFEEAKCRINLANALSRRFNSDGDPADIDRAIAELRLAIGVNAGQVLGGKAEATLGEALQERFRRRGEYVDLQAAMKSAQMSVASCQRNSMMYPAALNNVGNCARQLYMRTREIHYLHHAIDSFQQAVDSPCIAIPDVALYHHNLGFANRQLFEHTRDPAALARARTEHETAVRTCSDDDVHKLMYQTNLGSVLLEQANFEQNPALLDRVVEIRRKVFNSMDSVPRSDRVAYIHHFGTALAAQAQYTRLPHTFSEALLLYRRACEEGVTVHPEEALVSAKNWFNIAWELNVPNEIIAAFDYVDRVTTELFRRQVSRNAKESWLYDRRGRAVRAAWAHVQLGDDAAAVVTLERDRAILLRTSLARDEADLSALVAMGQETLANRFQESVVRTASLERTLGSQIGNVDLDLHSRIAESQSELSRVIEDIRRLPGHEEFLRAPDLEDIFAAAEEQTLIYLAATERGGFALIVDRGGRKPRPVSLRGLTVSGLSLRDTDLEHLVEQYSAALREASDGETAAVHHWMTIMDVVSGFLWDEVMSYVLYNVDTGFPVMLIPCGLLGFLPIHAAWQNDRDSPSTRRYMLDDFDIRYAPSAFALTHAQSRARTKAADTALAVVDPQPSPWSALHYARQEFAIPALWFSYSNEVAGLDAQCENVLSLIEQSEVLHFACHGRVDFTTPLQSGLVMSRGEVLTLERLLTTRMQRVRLAVLSACDSGLYGTELQDEVVSLPMGLLQAGACGVIASLWGVDDFTTAILMVRFYAFWRLDSREPPNALAEAQRWVRDSTNREKAEFFEQIIKAAGSISVKDPVLAEKAERSAMVLSTNLRSWPAEEKSHLHPFYWAAFYYSGI